MAGSFVLDDALTIPMVNEAPFVDEFMPYPAAASLVSRRSPVVVADQLPSVKMTPDDMANDACSICMDNFVGGAGDRTAKRVPCGHVYHGDCILSWLSHSDSCPLCRSTVSSSSSSGN